MTGLALLAASPGAPLTTKRSQKAALEIANYHRAKDSTLNTPILGDFELRKIPISTQIWETGGKTDPK